MTGCSNLRKYGSFEKYLRTNVWPDERGCWNWIRNVDACGYAYCCWTGEKSHKGHRLSYKLLVGPITNQVNHHCNNRRCVNPKHLYDGTQQQNVDDLHRTGYKQIHSVKGGEHGMAQIANDVQALAILNDPRLVREIAAEHKVSKGIIWDIKARRTWKHIT